MMKKHISIETKLTIASGALQATASKLEEITKDADEKCECINSKIQALEKEIINLQHEKTDTENLRATAYRQMCNINKILDGEL